MIAATPAFEREEDQRLIGQILESMNSNLNANIPNGDVPQEQAAAAAAQEQNPAHWNVTMKALVQMSILDMLAKWTSHAKDSDPEKNALDVSLKLVQSVLRTMKNKFQADSRLLFSGVNEDEAGGTVTQGSGDNIPLYRWLLPRLCFAASEFQANALLRPYVNETLDLAAYLVDSVGQYLDTQAPEGAMGLYLGKSLISGLTISCNGTSSSTGMLCTVRADLGPSRTIEYATERTTRYFHDTDRRAGEEEISAKLSAAKRTCKSTMRSISNSSIQGVSF